MRDISDTTSNTLNKSVGANNGSNNSEVDPDLRFLTLPLVLVFAFIGLLITAVNSLVIFLMYKKKTLRTPTNVFLTSLAVSDLISGVVGIPLFFVCSTVERGFYSCVSSAIFIRFTAISSVCHVLLVAYDRYIHIVHPLQHTYVITKRRAIGAIFFAWLFSFAASVIQLSWYGLNESDLRDYDATTENIDLQYSRACLVLFFGIPLFLMCFIYGRIFYISFTHMENDRRLTNALQQPRCLRRREWRGSSVLLMMVVIFTGCWLPFFLQMLNDHKESSLLSPMPLWATRLLVILRFIPPFSNPLLCTLSKHDFRSVFKTAVFQKILMGLSIEVTEQITLNTRASQSMHSETNRFRSVSSAMNSHWERRDRDEIYYPKYIMVTKIVGLLSARKECENQVREVVKIEALFWNWWIKGTNWRRWAFDCWCYAVWVCALRGKVSQIHPSFKHKLGVSYKFRYNTTAKIAKRYILLKVSPKIQHIENSILLVFTN